MSDGIAISKEEMVAAFTNGIREHLYTQEHMGTGGVNSAIQSAIKESVSEIVTKEMVETAIKSACDDFLQSNREDILKLIGQGASPKRRSKKPSGESNDVLLEDFET